jgi:hypothetical protein
MTFFIVHTSFSHPPAPFPHAPRTEIMAGANVLKRTGVCQPTTVSSILRLTMWLAILDHVCILAIPCHAQEAETPRMNSSSLFIG